MQLPVKLEPDSGVTLQIQLFDAIRNLILAGLIKPGEVVPSTRALSRQLGVSRNTVLIAYDRLVVEGYLESRPPTGTLVSPDLPDASVSPSMRPNAPISRSSAERQATRHPVLFKGRAHPVANPNRHRLAIDFWVGRPDPHSFPTKSWRRRLLHNLAFASANLTEYGDPIGILKLRSAIADFLGPARGIKVEPDQVIVVNGSQAALNLVARLLIEKGTTVMIEQPCYQGAAFVFESYGATLRAVPVDDRGADTTHLPDEPASLAYVTPSHQYPLGVTLSLERRLKLLDWAWKTKAYLIEDDYDNDFRHNGSPLIALAGQDVHGCVIYIGTFSKSIGAGIRLGYMVVPPELVEPARVVKTLYDNGQAWLDQATLADFISSGSYNRHLRRIRRTYLSRRDCLVEALQYNFGEVRLTGLEGGMHLAWHLPPDFPQASLIQKIAEDVGVGVYGLNTGAAFNFAGNNWDGERILLIGYSSVTEDQIRDGIARLARALHSIRKP